MRKHSYSTDGDSEIIRTPPGERSQENLDINAAEPSWNHSHESRTFPE
jgi:hypothetical protein